MRRGRSPLPIAQVLLSVAILLAARQALAQQTATIQFVDRLLYGPGPFPDQSLRTGHLDAIELSGFLEGEIKPFNNGAEPPNVSGEVLQGKTVNGKMSDGTLLNERVDMANAVIMNGQFNLLLGAVLGGPSGGKTRLHLDPHDNWVIEDDIAIDPGFAAGVVHIDRFMFSTAPRQVPVSIQTEKGYPAGMDAVGSLKSGDIVVGRVGDDDFDGHVDGVFMALGRFPLSAVFLPGAPFAQRFTITSNIPIGDLDAALLTLAGARNALAEYGQFAEAADKPGGWELLPQFAKERVDIARLHLEKAARDRASCRTQCVEALRALKDLDAANSLRAGELSGQLPLIDRVLGSLQDIHRAQSENPTH